MTGFIIFVALMSAVTLAVKLGNMAFSDELEFSKGREHGVRVARGYTSGRLSKKGFNAIRYRVIKNKGYSSTYVEGFCAGVEEMLC